MVPKQIIVDDSAIKGFRAVLFRMVPKHLVISNPTADSFRAVLFRMVPKLFLRAINPAHVLELCCFEWFQNPCAAAFCNICGFRAVLFRMVPKPEYSDEQTQQF